ncbi:ABC transporter substrate-binding protein [Paracoccus pantotrophus]|uniref:ABC transporter substrate-binding protein n=1 Tax=Paracoccus pantotrophus TaxID=82367 RepID=UPI0004ADE69F|nr:ABC transporter substrate-binding protein [Paracoccus pantotrophus]
MRFRNVLMAATMGVGALVAMAPQAGADTVKIGVIAPLTGGGAPWGIAMDQAAHIAAAEANADGGLDIGGAKSKVEIIAYDDQYKAAEAVSAYNRLINQDGVKYVVILTSASTLAIKENIESDQVLGLTAAFTSKSIDENTHYMMRLSSIPINYAKPLANWMAQNLKERRVVIVNPNDETGWETAKFDEEAFKAAGFEIAGSELFDRSQKEFQPLLTKIIAMNPEIINVGSTAPSTSGLIIRQARDLGYKGLFVKTGGPGPKEILEAAGSKEAVEGVVAMAFADPGTEGFRRLAGEYSKAIGQEPNQMIAPYYDAINVLLHAIEKAGTVDDTAAVIAAMGEVLPMPSIQGGELHHGDRQILSPIFVTQMKDGEAVVVGSVAVTE